jgi:drug/metabolite transporter (DMT)-like permease
MNSDRNAADWALFSVLTLIWAGAYALTRVAVERDNPLAGLPVEWVVAGRLTIGAVALLILMRIMGQSLPKWSQRRHWVTIILMGVVGSVLPFFFITTAQQTVNSSLAALYTAAAPIFVVIGAHLLFHDERMTPRKILGILAGFAGVAILFGPDAVKGFGDASVIAQILLIFATASYAASTLLARGAPPMPSIAFAAGFVSVAAIVSWPMALTVDPSSVQANWQHWAAVAALGIGPSAIAQALYMVLVRRAGATFLSLTGYSIPIVSAGLGWLFFRETQQWNAVIAFALILSGVWLARRGGGAPSSKG